MPPYGRLSSSSSSPSDAQSSNLDGFMPTGRSHKVRSLVSSSGLTPATSTSSQGQSISPKGHLLSESDRPGSRGQGRPFFPMSFTFCGQPWPWCCGYMGGNSPWSLVLSPLLVSMTLAVSRGWATSFQGGPILSKGHVLWECDRSGSREQDVLSCSAFFIFCGWPRPCCCRCMGGNRGFGASAYKWKHFHCCTGTFLFLEFHWTFDSLSKVMFSLCAFHRQCHASNGTATTSICTDTAIASIQSPVWGQCTPYMLSCLDQAHKGILSSRCLWY